MNPTNKNPKGARGIPQAFNWQEGHAPSSKPVVAQLKRGVSAQSIKRPVAPPAYRPQTMANAAQPKMPNAAVNQKSVGAPPIYRPQPVPKVLQTKSSPAQSSRAGQAPRQSVTLLVDRQMARAAQPDRSPKSPPIHHPHRQVSLVQRQAAARGVVQRVCATCGGDEVMTTDGTNTWNGHLSTCPNYHRTYYTVQDRLNGFRTRSGSYRSLEQTGGGLGPTGLYTQPTYGLFARHYHDNTGIGGQVVIH